MLDLLDFRTHLPRKTPIGNEHVLTRPGRLLTPPEDALAGGTYTDIYYALLFSFELPGTMIAAVTSLQESEYHCSPMTGRFAQFAIRLSTCVSVLAVLVTVTELIAGALLSFPQERENAGQDHGYYQDKPWAKEYFKEFELAGRQQYMPYVLWRHAPFTGKYLNVDERGLRRTVDPDCSPKATQIWAFGASTLWGVGAPDDQTIPSILSREYARAIGPVCVTNFGEPAWVSNQNVIQLEIALKHASRPPDLVLFYDGLADVIAVYQNGNGDGHFSVQKIRNGIEGPGARRHSSFAYLKETATWRLIEVIMNQVATWEASRAPARRPTRNLDNLAKIAVENYRANLKIVEALSAKYGFQYISFWEPMILAGNKPLSDPERRMLEAINESAPGLPALCRRTYGLMFSVPNSYIVNIADTFDHTERDTYMAVGHIDPEGNRQVALRILEVLRKSDKARVSPRNR